MSCICPWPLIRGRRRALRRGRLLGLVWLSELGSWGAGVRRGLGDSENRRKRKRSAGPSQEAHGSRELQGDAAIINKASAIEVCLLGARPRWCCGGGRCWRRVRCLVVWPGQLQHRVGDAMGSDRRSTKQCRSCLVMPNLGFKGLCAEVGLASTRGQAGQDRRLTGPGPTPNFQGW
jgi:hypothetical protein